MSTADSEPPKTLCYRQSYYRKKDGRITEKQYFHYLFQHLTGVEHKGDDQGTRDELEDLDPLGYSINCWIVQHSHEPVDDSTPFQDVFDAYRNGTVDDIKSALGKLKKGYESEVRRSLALIALQERNAPVLKWLLDDGIEQYEECFEDEVRRVQKKHDPETWKVLQDTAEKTKRPWTKSKRPRNGHPLD